MSATSIIKGQTKPDSAGSARRELGFTLIELMVVVAIAAILVGIAIPMFDESLKRNRRLSALESVAGMVASARTEAVSRSTTVALCPSNDDASACSGTNEWEKGALMFEDDDEDGVFDAGEELVRTFMAAGVGITIRSKGGFGSDLAIMFDQFGAVADAGTVVICDVDQEVGSATGLVLNASGQTRLAIDENDSGVINLDVVDGGGNTIDLGACP